MVLEYTNMIRNIHRVINVNVKLIVEYTFVFVHNHNIFDLKRISYCLYKSYNGRTVESSTKIQNILRVRVLLLYSSLVFKFGLFSLMHSASRVNKN